MSNIPDMPDDRAISLLAVDQYYRALRWTEQLTEEEEAKYLERVARGVAERAKPAPNQWVLRLALDARDRLVERYQPMVAHMARRFSHRFTHFQFMDCVQEGNIGLLKALDAFASVEGFCFAAYASLQIHHAISAALRVYESPCGAGAPTKALLSKLRRFESAFFNENGCAPDGEEIAEGLGITALQVADLLQGRKMQEASSLQQVMMYESGQEEKEDFSSLYASSVKQEDERQKRLRAVLDHAMDTLLTPYQKEAVSLRFDLLEDRPSVETYEELAQAVGISCSRVAFDRYERGVSRLRKLLVLRTENHLPSCEILQADYYTVTQVALLLGVNVETVRRYIGAGLLPAKLETVPLIGGEIYKLPKEPVEALLAERKKVQVAEAEMKNYYTTAQAASLLEISMWTIRRYVSSGRLPGKKFKVDGVQKLLIPKQVVDSFVSARIPSIVA